MTLFNRSNQTLDVNASIFVRSDDQRRTERHLAFGGSGTRPLPISEFWLRRSACSVDHFGPDRMEGIATTEAIDDLRESVDGFGVCVRGPVDGRCLYSRRNGSAAAEP